MPTELTGELLRNQYYYTKILSSYSDNDNSNSTEDVFKGDILPSLKFRRLTGFLEHPSKLFLSDPSKVLKLLSDLLSGKNKNKKTLDNE